MGTKIKTIFTIILLSFLISPQLNASEKIKLPKYESLYKKLVHEQLMDLAKLKGQIKSSYVKDATKLAKAIKHLEKGHDNAAYSLLKKISKRSILSDYISYYRAKALMGEKKYQKALKELPPQKSPVKKIDLERFWLRMNLLALTNSRNKEKLRAEIADLKKIRRKDKWVDIKGNYYKGLAEFESKNKQAAYSYFRNVLVKNPGSEFDKKIFDLLENNGIKKNKALSEANWNLRADKLVANGFPHEALKIWQGFYKKSKRYQERVAYGTYRSRNYKKAAVLYEEVLKTGNYSNTEVGILSKIASSYFRHDNFDNAIKYHKLILEKYPQSRAASIANFKLGFIYFDSGQYEKAATYLEKFLTKGSRWQKDRARWFRLWSFYLTKQYDAALQEMDAWEKDNGKRKAEKIQLMYWKARIAQKLGKKELAHSLYKKVIRWDGLDYYGLLARQRLSGKKLHAKTLIHPKTLSMVPSGKSKPPKHKLNLKSIPQTDPILKAILLANIGLDNYAFNESRYSAYAQSVPDYNAAKAIEEAGNFNKGYAIRNKTKSGALSGANQLEGFRLAFPQAYNKFVEPYAKIWNIDEMLAYAVMRQESAFKPEALSYAFAYGLMQIIPPTGDEIAQKINFKGFEVSQLNDPRINTLFGTYYLRFLLDEFNNNLIYAIAGYNAGPHNVKRWTAKNRNLETDEFIEMIPFKETNKYVKKVLVNYMVYNKIYP